MASSSITPQKGALSIACHPPSSPHPRRQRQIPDGKTLPSALTPYLLHLSGWSKIQTAKFCRLRSARVFWGPQGFLSPDGKGGWSHRGPKGTPKFQTAKIMARRQSRRQNFAVCALPLFSAALRPCTAIDFAKYPPPTGFIIYTPVGVYIITQGGGGDGDGVDVCVKLNHNTPTTDPKDHVFISQTTQKVFSGTTPKSLHHHQQQMVLVGW